eukprot:11866.XXX_77485_76385_1 [CDS] Oithona nana genome sequencing.
MMSKNPYVSNPTALPRKGITASSRRQNSSLLSNTKSELNPELKYIPRLDSVTKVNRSPILTYTPSSSSSAAIPPSSTSRKQLPPPSELDRNDLKRISLRSRKGQRANHPIFQDPPATVSPATRVSGVQAKILKEKLDFHQQKTVTRIAKPKIYISKAENNSLQRLEETTTMMQNGRNRPRGTSPRPSPASSKAKVAPASPRPPPSRPRSNKVRLL